MIYDRLDRIEIYKGLYDNLDKAIEYLQSVDLSELKNGKVEVDSNDIYLNIVDGQLINESDGVYELHKTYLDIHIDIEGKEKLLISDYDDSKKIEEYNDKGDYELIQGIKTGECILDNNHFAICMLDEPHMPCVRNNDEDNVVRKIIVKVKVKW